MTTYYGAIHKSKMGYDGNIFSSIGEFSNDDDAASALTDIFDDARRAAEKVEDGFPASMGLGAMARNGRPLVLATMRRVEIGSMHYENEIVVVRVIE